MIVFSFENAKTFRSAQYIFKFLYLKSLHDDCIFITDETPETPSLCTIRVLFVLLFSLYGLHFMSCPKSEMLLKL
jgi:hypothetical protein